MDSFPIDMSSFKKTIVLIALDQNMLKIITTYLSDKYHFVAINRDFDVGKLNVYSKISLFIINTDSVKVKIPDVIKEILDNELFKSIPKIGLSLKQHHASMESNLRLKFEDFVLMPCGHEDLLTRIDVWIKTYKSILTPTIDTKTYSLDTLFG